MDAVRNMLMGTMLCNDSALDYDGKQTYTPVGAPTEVALITGSLKAGLHFDNLKNEHPRVHSVPFESEHKFMATIHAPFAPGEGRMMFVKGAPDRVMSMCDRQVAGDTIEDLKSKKTEPLDKDMWIKAQ
eukprot:278191-Chlamydomonas_euryale.AAC.1